MRATLERALVALLVGVPVVSLALNAIAWLTYGLDLPFFDDWRGYAAGNIDSLDPGYLFAHVNDTLAPVGFALDALAQRLLNGNPLPYQFLSMTIVLGGLLYFQWKLLRLALGVRWHAAACFALTLLMLQPGSYWGRENLAYHQALPLLCLLPALWLILNERARELWRLPLVLALGLVGGLSYVSGAFAMLAAGLTLLLTSPWAAPTRSRLMRGSGALAIAGVITVAMQLYPLLTRANLANRAYAPLAWPYESDFWWFLLGKLGRSLLLPSEAPELALGVVLLVAALALLAFALTAWRIVRRGALAQGLPVPQLVFVALAAVTFVYLMLVAAGRTNLRPEELNAWHEVFAHGFSRFHFFWATILWPWLAAVVIAHLGRTDGRPRMPANVAATVPVLLVPLIVSAGALDHFHAHREEVKYRLPTISCLMEQLQRGEGISCHEFNMPDFSPAFEYGRRIGASFVRHFPILPIALGADDPPPLFRLSRDESRLGMANLSRAAGAGDRFVASADAQMRIRSGEVAAMADCSLLQVVARLKPAFADTAQVYFRRRGQESFSEENSVRIGVAADGEGPATVRFNIESTTGFEDDLRFDPVTREQTLAIEEVEVRCRLAGAIDPERNAGAIPLYRLGAGSGELETVGIYPDAGAGLFRAGDDPQLLVRTQRAEEMRACAKIGIDLVLRTELEDFAQVFFRPLGAAQYTEAHSRSLTVSPSTDGQLLRFSFSSPNGFEDELRLDPVSRPQTFGVKGFEVSCLARTGAAGAVETERR